MKKFFVTMVAVVGGLLSANAQYDVKGLAVEDFPDVIEITITSRLLSDNVNVDVDAGQDTANINLAGRKNYALTHSDSNNRVEFESPAEAIGFFYKLGYKIVAQNGSKGMTRGNSTLVKLLGVPNLSKGLSFVLVRS